MQSSKLPSLEQLDNDQLLGLAALSAGEYCRQISEEWYQRLELAGDTINELPPNTSVDQVDNEELLALSESPLTKEWYRRVKEAWGIIEYVKDCRIELEDDGDVPKFIQMLEEKHL